MALLAAIAIGIAIACGHGRGIEPLPTTGIERCSLVVRDERRNIEVIGLARDPGNGFLVAVGADKKSAAHWAPIWFKVDGDRVEVRGMRGGHTGSIERTPRRVTLRQVGSQILDASDDKIVYNGICPGRGGASDSFDRCVDYEFHRGQGLGYRTRGLVNERFVDFVRCGDRLEQVPSEMFVALDLYLLRLPASSTAGGLEMNPSAAKF
ncbi:MAG: hypothetical protein JXR83_04315 [Deltaproteobacteria bacterium]|nr:hypothetical protein [Deltaproteobacteria bacterium]